MEKRPAVVMLAGLPGSGKTTLALALASRLGFVAIDKDTLKSALLGAGVTESIAGPASYRLMEAMAEDLVLRQGHSVVLDSPGVYPATLEFSAGLAEKAGAALKVVVLLAERDVRNQRALARKSLPSQPRPPREQDEDDGRGRFLHLPTDRLELRGTLATHELVDQAMEYIARRP